MLFYYLMMTVKNLLLVVAKGLAALRNSCLEQGGSPWSSGRTMALECFLFGRKLSFDLACPGKCCYL